jgi:hypothetical protein
MDCVPAWLCPVPAFDVMAGLAQSPVATRGNPIFAIRPQLWCEGDIGMSTLRTYQYKSASSSINTILYFFFYTSSINHAHSYCLHTSYSRCNVPRCGCSHFSLLHLLKWEEHIIDPKLSIFLWSALLISWLSFRVSCISLGLCNSKLVSCTPVVWRPTFLRLPFDFWTQGYLSID